MARAVLAVCALALVCTGASPAARAGTPTVQEVTIAGAGGVQLACDFVLPPGPTPDGGWPGIVLFPSLGVSLDAYYYDGPLTVFAFDGFASVACYERGTGSSAGSFDLAGPLDAQDAQAIFTWLAAQPSVSPAKIGAEGLGDLAGAEVWDAAVAGVPFKAIVTGYTWSSLDRALKPTGVLNTRLFRLLSTGGPTTWNTAPGIAARSYRKHLDSLTVPTLIVQPRRGFRWDLSQATAAYRLLSGPKLLSVSWFYNPDEAWFTHYLAGGPKIAGGVEIQSERPDRTITKFHDIPRTRSVTVNLPGTGLRRSVWMPGGPLETFGGGSVTIRYSGASWQQVVAKVSTANGTVVTEGAAAVTQRSGVLKIRLLNEMALLPRGKKLTVALSSHDATFGGPSGGKIAVDRVTLKLSVLQRAVSH